MVLSVEQVEEIFGDVFWSQDGEGFEISCHTDGGYNIVLEIPSRCLIDIRSVVKDLDPSHEVSLWWSNDAYRSNYSGDIRAAYDDIEDWKRDILSQIEELAYQDNECQDQESDYEKAERMFHALIDELGEDMLLNDLYLAMSTDHAIEYFEHIARMNDIEL